MDNNRLKFRIWDNHNKLFLNSELFCIDLQGQVQRIGSVGTISNITVQQFTGLLDKNGKEIFEGDINYDYNGKITEVVFYAGGFYLKGSSTDYVAIGSIAPFNYCIIGNIFENKTLLNND